MSILDGLSKYKQFIVYLLVPKEGGKTDKLPVNHMTLEVASAHDQHIWIDAETAVRTVSMLGPQYGVGFVFTANDPFFFIDIDNCVQDGVWGPIATELCGKFQGAAMEISQSGTGLHIIGSASRMQHGCKNTSLGLELYTEGRFVALTDTGTVGIATADMSQALSETISKYFPVSASLTSEDWRNAPVEGWSGPEDDDELVNRALRSGGAKAMFGGGVTFKDLWYGAVDILSRSYPAINPADPYDRSSADAALAQHLAFWTGKNHERIKRLMLKSALVRDKWTKHKSYIARTINRAVSKQVDVYCQRAPVDSTPDPTPKFLTAQLQGEHFKGCTYVRDQHRVLIPDGSFLKPDQFKVTYGGYNFFIDAECTKTTKNAWEAFTENQAVQFPRVTGTCFRPEIPTGAIVKEEGLSLINTYVPIITKRRAGNVDPFLNHLRNILPKERDMLIFLSYMAACVQYPGVKSQWCPILQGGEGNGKTLFGKVLSFAVGHRYTHLPNASDLAGNGVKFNLWLYNKLLIIIEEIYVNNRRELTEPFKVLVTNDRMEFQGKGQDQFTGDLRANILMFTNHKDALPVTIDSRRYCILYSAQQCAADLIRQGMDEKYFYALYNWLKFEHGYEICNEFLHTYSIPEEFDFSKQCQRAPATTSTMEAVELSRGGIEQAILDAIEEGRPGFNGGWVSSIAIAQLLSSMHAERQLPIARRRAAMNSLGYDWHQGLPGGRTNTPVPVEGGKPKLFIRIDHKDAELTCPNEIVKRYMIAQSYPV